MGARSTMGRIAPESMRKPSSRNWFPLALMNKNEYFTPRRLAFRLIGKLRVRIASIKNQFTPKSLAKSGSGGPATEMTCPPGLSTRSDFERLSAQGVEDNVVIAHDGFEIILLVVDDDVCSEALHPLDVRRARGR